MSDLFPHYIEFRHVYKTFDRPVLVDINFYLNAGQTLAIIGRSGVGKSVSLGHIMGFLKPDKGRIIVAHTDITDADETELRRIRKKVTMVFQNGALFEKIAVPLHDEIDDRIEQRVTGADERRLRLPRNVDQFLLERNPFITLKDGIATADDSIAISNHGGHVFDLEPMRLPLVNRATK